MFNRINTINYIVPDIQKATEWYQKILNKKLAVDNPFMKAFQVGDSFLVLTQMMEGTPFNKIGIVANYWVNDVDSAYKQLIEAGATPRVEINIRGSMKGASVFDPFGNILTFSEIIADTSELSLEKEPSTSAHGIAVYRALAALDEREEIRGKDYLAEVFLEENAKAIIKNPALRKRLLESQADMYEYIIARTAFFDYIVEHALNDNIPQMVFLGAGYDSRPYRFKEKIQDTRIFELDIKSTQNRKKELLRQAKIQVPEQLTFVSINFNTDMLEDALLKAGYRNDQKTLFIWEGVTMYLPEKIVDDTFHFIKSSSEIGSIICFDYTTDAQKLQEMKDNNPLASPSEPFLFDIKEGQIEIFLSDKGYKVIEHLKASDMAKKYLNFRDDSSALHNAPMEERMSQYLCFVCASTVGNAN